MLDAFHDRFHSAVFQYLCDTFYDVMSLRWRIIWQKIALDLKIAQNLNILVGTAHNICELFQATGEVDHKQQPKCVNTRWIIIMKFTLLD